MKKFYKNSKKYVLLSLLSMSLVLQSCKMEGEQAIIPTVKQLPGVRSKISQDDIDIENPGSHRQRSRPIEEEKFTGKREREKEKQETSLVQTQVKRKKLEWLEDENISSEDEEEIINTEGCSWQDGSVDQQRRNPSSPMNLVTFFKAISESNKARTAIKEEAKRVRKEKGKEWKLEEEDDDDDEVLRNIFQHLPPKTIINLTETNPDLYKFFNDCQEIGLVGVDKINPSTCFNPYKIRHHCYSDFDKVTYTPEKIPSVPFGRIMQQVSDLPKPYWPYIDKTNIRVISLAAKRITNDDFIDLWKCLQNSKVQELNLSYNHITDEIAKEITELPKPKSISKVILCDNDLTEVGKSRLQAIYPNVTWIF